MVFKFDDCGKLVEFTLKSTKFSKSAVNYGASKFWSIFRNSSKNIVEIAFLFRGTVTQKRTGCFEKGGYRANKLLFWIFPLGGVGDTEKNLSYSSFFSGTPSFCTQHNCYARRQQQTGKQSRNICRKSNLSLFTLFIWEISPLTIQEC